MANINLEVVTPQKVLLTTEAEYVTLPGEIGELGILPGHIPLLTSLRSGVLSYKTGGTLNKIAVHFGYAEVCRDQVTVLADVAELANNINIERARSAQQSAESALAEALKETDQHERVESLNQDLQKAITRQTAGQ
jgi:F-type H+-transporting ATPase subunit epsilon